MSKILLHTIFCLLLKLSKAFIVSLNLSDEAVLDLSMMVVALHSTS